MDQRLQIGDVKHTLGTSKNMKLLKQIQNGNESHYQDRCAVDLEARHVARGATRARAPPQPHLKNCQ